MSKIEYRELLKNPKWINKRNKIFKRDNYRCTCCCSKKDLEVHHTYYFRNHPEPWLYPNKSLLTLCSDCHYKYHIYHEIKIVSSPKREKIKYKKRKLLSNADKLKQIHPKWGISMCKLIVKLEKSKKGYYTRTGQFDKNIKLK